MSVLAFAASAQTLPTKVTSLLNKHYTGWKPATGTCDARKWFLTGDFDGDGLKDFLVRVKAGRSTSSMRLSLIAFLGAKDGKYSASPILAEPFQGDLLRSSFSVISKGTRIQLGEGEGPSVTLANDAASQYICQTDAIKTMIYEDGKWKNIYEQ